jgi:hypothetical protein
MLEDFSWARSAKIYRDLYSALAPDPATVGARA